LSTARELPLDLPEPEGFSSAASVLLSLGLGTLGCLFTGFLAFRFSVFDPRLPAFQCVTVGLVAAAIFALVRASFHRHALALALGFAALQIPVALRAVIAGLLLGLGLFLSALIFDLLAARGVRLGKWLLAGPLVGGVFLAVTPIAEFARLELSSAANVMVAEFGVGMIIGHGTGLGLEIADMLGTLRQPDL
jgi:hypothetical protein